MPLPNPLGDLFKRPGPSGGNPGIKEQDREELIRRLKSVKDPHERDRILYALSRREEDVVESSKPARPASPPKEKGASVPGMQLPELASVKNLLPFAVPFLLLLMGLFYIMGAISRLHPKGRIEDVGAEIFMGLMFLGFGIFGMLKAKNAKSK
ncbi:MAG: hypothetical protein PHG91_06465 [Syntrophales bacterium]|nr:hypothetical protein [Syntrophales bacterium]MDD5531680.1 hypothetical protein [Syntrophales bacterium]